MPAERPRFLLDTQVAIRCYASGFDSLPPRIKKALDPRSICYISPISFTEVCIKNRIGKLEMTVANLKELMRDLVLTELPYSMMHAEKLADLPLHHRDPFDRMLIATALAEKIPLLSSDRHFQKYAGLRVIW